MRHEEILYELSKAKAGSYIFSAKKKKIVFLIVRVYANILKCRLQVYYLVFAIKIHLILFLFSNFHNVN